jgi:hypothetical protein
MQFKHPSPLEKVIKNILRISGILFIFFIVRASCQRTRAPHPGEIIQLAVSTENFVKVAVTLENKGDDQILLSATYIPLTPGLHLYSKDIPKKGVDGLGRPTLLELSTDTWIQAKGGMVESVPSHPPPFDPKALLVYPAGSVTLSIPILLPEGEKWFNEQVLVTYMACNEQGCRPPVEEKVIPIQIPGSGLIKP